MMINESMGHGWDINGCIIDKFDFSFDGWRIHYPADFVLNGLTLYVIIHQYYDEIISDYNLK